MSKHWYEITQETPTTVSVVIDGPIGGFGVTSAEFKAQIESLGEFEELTAHITSRGGQVFEGLAMAEYIQSLDAKTVAVIEGLAGSMAATLAMAFDEVEMTTGSLLFIHNARVAVEADAKGLRDFANDLDTIGEPLFNFYASRNLTISNEELQAALDKETYYTANQALSIGYIDRVRKKKADLKATAKLDWNEEELSSLPKQFSNRLKQEIQSTHDGPAVPTQPEGKSMPDEKALSEAEIEARVKAAVDANDEKWKSLLAHNNSSNTAAVLEIGAMNLTAEQSVSMMNLVGPGEVKQETKVETPSQENATSQTTKVMQDFMDKVMSMSEMNGVNPNASTESDKPADEDPNKDFDPKEAYRAARGR